jgi:hypothetical protein
MMNLQEDNKWMKAENTETINRKMGLQSELLSGLKVEQNIHLVFEAVSCT